MQETWLPPLIQGEPHAAEQPGPVPQPLSMRSRTWGPCALCPGARARRCREKPPPGEARALRLECGPRLPQLEKARGQQ